MFKTRFILRNHLAQDCIESAEKDDFVETKIFLRLLENPFSTESIEDLLKDMNLDDNYKASNLFLLYIFFKYELC